MTRTLVASLVGGLVLFLWGFVSHGLLPFHDMAYQRFADEHVVSETLQEHATTSGLYYVPFSQAEHASDRLRAFINVLVPGTELSLPRQVVVGLLTQIIVVLLGILLIGQTGGASSYLTRVRGFVVLGTLIGLATPAFYWNWFGFPTFYTLVMISDSIIGWTLVGIVTAALTARAR
jgi:hypothetical protein